LKAYKKEQAILKAGAPEPADTRVDMVGDGGDEALMQKRHHHSHRARDTFDNDPDTSSMYDNGHVYTDTAGSIKWKYAGGPAAEYQAATGYNPYKLVQHKHRHHHRARDTYD
jgi:3',5'-cyclic AMP phosphodiesterase CpdA